MKDVMDMLNILNNSNKLLRDINYCLTGFFFLLVLNYLFQFNLDSYPNLIYLNGWGIFFGIITTSYFFARFSCELGSLMVATLVFLLAYFLRISKKEFISERRVMFRKFLSNEPINLNKDKKDISPVELESFIAEKRGLNFSYERDIQNIILENSFLGFFVILGFIYSPLLFLTTPIFLYRIIDSRVYLLDKKVKIAEFLLISNGKEEEHKE